MRKANIYMHGILAGVLEELDKGGAGTTRAPSYRFGYVDGYAGQPVSLTMPITGAPYDFNRFPPIFDGLLPEGVMLEGLLRAKKIDRTDCFGQLIAVGQDMVGAITAAKIE